MLFNSIFLMGGDASQGSDNPLMSMLPIILIGAVMYFFMIRPQVKKSKDQKKYIAEIKKGDDIITIGGIHGKIADVKEDSFIIEVENNVRLKINKASVSLDGATIAK
ncbi:MAG: preprotein translocase subunit YajC [Sphingobacteriales bacterium]|jgi:preprotein translocase subunit YajC